MANRSRAVLCRQQSCERLGMCGPVYTMGMHTDDHNWVHVPWMVADDSMAKRAQIMQI